MNEIATIQSQGLVSYNKEQVQLIKDMYAKKATDDELKLMMYMSNKYGLDILTKQIWCVKFGEAAAQIYAGRDGFLEIGHRSGNFNGMDTKIARIEEGFSIPYTAWENGKKVSKVFNTDYQFVATCTVYRKDMEHPITVEVYEEEYSTGQNLWQTKRRTMIGKVAESQALRKAFSISGIYAEEEMYQDKTEINENRPTTEEVVEVDEIINRPLSNDKVEAIKAKAKAKGINQKSICAAYNLETFYQMSITEWLEAMDKLDLRPDKKANILEGVI